MLKILHAVVLIYLQPFRRNSLLECVSQPEIAKKSPKPIILRVQGHRFENSKKLFTSADKQYICASL